MSDLVNYLGNVGNCAIVVIPGRKYPGIVFQGDTFASYLEQLNVAIDALKKGEKDLALEEFEDLRDQFSAYLKSYEKISKSNGY
ncbi:DUF6959 family protein [Paracidovorax oryzae]|uniref:DUF6959 family protein n=1 Tax=Paracidovorax oryzae TaxID=862720 RepID=UPI0035D05562